MAGTAAAALWCGLRNKKYPLAVGYPLINKFIVPGFFLSPYILNIPIWRSIANIIESWKSSDNINSWNTLVYING